MDRAYFRNKNKPKKERSKKSAIITKCCKQDITDRKILSKKIPHEWALIEQHCEDHLFSYPDTETIDPICCDVCGLLVEYICTLNEKAWKH